MSWQTAEEVDGVASLRCIPEDPAAIRTACVCDVAEVLDALGVYLVCQLRDSSNSKFRDKNLEMRIGPLSMYWLSQHTSASADPAVSTQVSEEGQHHVAPHAGASAGQVVLDAADPFVARDHPPLATAVRRERSGCGMRIAMPSAADVEMKIAARNSRDGRNCMAEERDFCR